MRQQEEIEKRFEELFNLTYEEGINRLKVLIRRTITFQRFEPGGTLSMIERDFGLVAFFACIGAGYIEELGISKLPEPKNTLDAEYEEILTRIKKAGNEGG